MYKYYKWRYVYKCKRYYEKDTGYHLLVITNLISQQIQKNFFFFVITSSDGALLKTQYLEPIP